MRPHPVLLTLIAAPLLLSVACSDDGDNATDTGLGDVGRDMSLPDLGRQDLEPDGQRQDVGSPDLPEPDAPGMPSAWTEAMSSLPASLNDIWGLDSSTVYAVGKDGLVMRYAGSGWSVMATPEKVNLWGIHGTDQHLVAVGDGMDLRYDGTSWNKGYATTSSNFGFRGALVPPSGTQVFTVGTLGNYIRYRTLSSSSTYWSYVSLGGLSSRTTYGIWAPSATEMFVVGAEGLIYRCSGSCTTSTDWTSMTSGVTSDLKGVYGFAPDDVYAVGLDGVILHYDGAAWTQMASGTSTYFQDVWGSGPNDVYAVGHPIFKQDESIFHYDGTAWTKLPPPRTSYLNAIWGSSATDIWIVGNYNILHHDGSSAP